MDVTKLFGNPLPQCEQPAASRFRILVLGDLGCEEAWGMPQRVDRDDLDDVFRKLHVRIPITTAAVPDTTVCLQELDDFHPDRLYQALDLFASLRARRRRLERDETFAAEADAILKAGQQHEAAPEKSEAPSLAPSDLLGQAIEQAEQSSQAAGPAAERIAQGRLNIEDYVRQVVAPFVRAKEDPRKQEFLDGVDDAISASMRNLLHDPAFQQVEAAWLGIQMMVRRLETDRTLNLSLLHVSQRALQDDLLSSDNLESTKLYERLSAPLNRSHEGLWTIVVGNYTFDASQNGTKLLGRLARLHAACGAVFVAAASPGIVGCADLARHPDPEDWNAQDADAAARWETLRAMPESDHVVLTAPRLLTRYPYGQSTMPIEAFQFDELTASAAHCDFLWLNGAFAVATLLGESFSRAGWSLRAGWSPELSGLPICVRNVDGDSTMQPCGEVELPETAVKLLSEAGLTLIRSVRNQGAILVPTLRSLSTHQADVMKRWER